MKNPIIIPEEINIHLLYELLNLSSMQQRAKLDTLKRYSLESDLLLSTHKEVKGLTTNIPLGDIYDENVFIEHHDAKEHDIEEFYLISFKLNQYFLTAEKTTTCINWFKINGESFHVVNDNNNDIGELFIDLSNVFVKKSDYDSFIKKATSQMNQVKAPYQDRSSEHFAPELDLAIRLHRAIHIEKYGNISQSIEDRVSEWFKEFFPDETISGAKISRMGTMIGIKK
jgi:hypothetical protein